MNTEEIFISLILGVTIVWTIGFIRLSETKRIKMVTNGNGRYRVVTGRWWCKKAYCRLYEKFYSQNICSDTEMDMTYTQALHVMSELMRDKSRPKQNWKKVKNNWE